MRLEGKNKYIHLVILVGVLTTIVSLFWYFLQNSVNAINSNYDYAIARSDAIYVSDNSRYRIAKIGKDSYIIKYPFELSRPESITKLVNKNTTLSKEYVPRDLVDVPISTQGNLRLQVRSELRQPLISMQKDAEKEGVNIFVRSAYRSGDEQQIVYDQIGSNYAARPGTSEHQTGLAVDINSGNSNCDNLTCSLSASASRWLALHAPDYGFIVRYQPGTESITGYPAEEWHLRYIGAKLAKMISSAHITLEEARSILEQASPRDMQ